MGRQAHQLRVALGLSADRAPNWSTLTDQYELITSPTSTGEARYAPIGSARSILGNQQYNDRGRPIDELIRRQDDEQCHALNETLDYAVCRIRDDAITSDEMVLKEILEDEAEFVAQEEQYMLGIEVLGVLTNYVVVAWIRSLRYQLLTYPATQFMTLTALTGKNAQLEGLISFVLIGLSSELVKFALVKARQQIVFWFQQRRCDQYKDFSSRSMWIKISPYIEQSIE